MLPGVLFRVPGGWRGMVGRRHPRPRQQAGACVWSSLSIALSAFLRARVDSELFGAYPARLRVGPGHEAISWGDFLRVRLAQVERALAGIEPAGSLGAARGDRTESGNVGRGHTPSTPPRGGW